MTTIKEDSPKRRAHMGWVSQVIIIVIFPIMFCSCTTEKDKDLVSGDLFFSEFRIGSYYNASDSLRNLIENIVDTTILANADSATIKLIIAYNKLKSDGLLYKPFIDLKVGSDSFVKLYLDSSDYDRIKVFKRQTLRSEEKKVVVHAKFKDAELKAKFPERSPGEYGSVYTMCVSDYLAELTIERTTKLKTWLEGTVQGDVCSGSVKIKD